MMTSSTSAGSRSLRLARAFRASEARSTACQFFSLPLRLPPGVRTASTMTAVGMVVPFVLGGRCPPREVLTVGAELSSRGVSERQEHGPLARRRRHADHRRRRRRFRRLRRRRRGPRLGRAGSFTPTELACNPHGTVQAGVHAVVLDAAMNFAINAALRGRDRTEATIEIKSEMMRPALLGRALRGARRGRPAGAPGRLRRGDDPVTRAS